MSLGGLNVKGLSSSPLKTSATLGKNALNNLSSPLTSINNLNMGTTGKCRIGDIHQRLPLRLPSSIQARVIPELALQSSPLIHRQCGRIFGRENTF